MTSKNRGITIIELLAVVTILGILAAIVTPVAQVVITRELELDLMRHLRGVRRGIDNSHEIAVRCWVDNVVNRKDSDRCRQCNNLLTAVLCPNPLHVNQSERWNARSLIRCNNAISAPPGPCLDPDGQGGYRLDNILCPVCNQKIPAFDSSTGEPIVRCTAIDPNTGSICGGVVEKYQNYPLTNYPTAFQDMYILNTLRFSFTYNPVTAGREDWDITLFRPPGRRSFDLAVNGVEIISYMASPPNSGTVTDGYPRKDATNGLLREGNGYILESWEWKSLLDEYGYLDLNKWSVYAANYGITVFDGNTDTFRSFGAVFTAYPNATSNSFTYILPSGITIKQIYLPQIYDVHFPLLSKVNRLTLDGKKKYSDL